MTFFIQKNVTKTLFTAQKCCFTNLCEVNEYKKYQKVPIMGLMEIFDSISQYCLDFTPLDFYSKQYGTVSNIKYVTVCICI